MHEQVQAFGVCLANKVSKPVRVARFSSDRGGGA